MEVLHLRNKMLCKGKTDHGDTALTLTCRLGEKETVELLLNKYGANINETGYRGMNGFLAAAAYGKHEIMWFLHSKNKKLQGVPLKI